MNWKRLLACITGSVDQELLPRNEYLETENRILRNQIKGRLRLTDPDRISLAEIGRRLGRRALAEVAQIVRPETILGWHRKLIARKFDGGENLHPRAPRRVAQVLPPGGRRSFLTRRPRLGLQIHHAPVIISP